MSLLDNIQSPKDLKKMNRDELEQLCSEIRDLLVQTVSHNGGHLASNLGVVELTVALHRVFNSPSDPIIFDVGHQCYTHKILTGRKDDFVTLRTEGGIAKVYLRGSLMVEDGKIVGGPEGQYLRRGLCTL